MQKDTFKISILILLIGGFITKIMGFIIKILFTRMIGSEGLSLYTLAMPTYSLMISIAIFALPISISKLVSEEKKRSSDIILSTTLFILIFNLIFSIIFLFLIPFISKYLLHEPNIKLILIAMLSTLPFISVSSILKGYFLGKLKVLPNTLSNIIEQTIRILFLLYLFPKILLINNYLGLISFILISVITETVSIVVFLLFLPKKTNINLKKRNIEPSIIKEVLNTSIPALSSRLIGNISFFLEPIILTNILLLMGYTTSYIQSEYAIFNAYVIGILTMPSFFISSICQILIPEVSKYTSLNNKVMLKRRVNKSLKYSFIIGFTSSFLILIFRDNLLNILYKTTNGSNYILLLAPVFTLFYLEAPLTSTLQAMGHAKESAKITLIGSTIKLITMTLTSLLKIGMYSLLISEIVNIFYVVIKSAKTLKKEL